MSFAGLLPHTCTVMRRHTAGSFAPSDDAAARDRFGQPLTSRDAVGTFRCRLSMPSGGETAEERSREVYTVKHKLYFESGTDVREDDEVKVTDSAGAVLCEKANVTLLKPVFGASADHHREAELRVVRGPRGG